MEVIHVSLRDAIKLETHLKYLARLIEEGYVKASQGIN